MQAEAGDVSQVGGEKRGLGTQEHEHQDGQEVVGALSTTLSQVCAETTARARTGGALPAVTETFSRLLITLQQLSRQTSLSRGALYWLIFCSSFWASSQDCSFLCGIV